MAARFRPFVYAAFVALGLIALGFAWRYGRPHRGPIDLPDSPSASVSAPVPITRRPVQLEGHVVDADGNAVAGAYVRAIAPGSVAETATDASGHFAFDRLAKGIVRVEADHDPEGAVDSAPITIGDDPKEVTLVLAPAAVDGVVVEGEEGKPIAGAQLSVEGVPFTSPRTTTDESGAFHFAFVPFEATAVVAIASGYKSARVTLGPREDAPTPRLKIVLRAAPAVDGDVTDTDGKPIHAKVVACEGKPFEVAVESADDGTFQLPPSTVGCEAFAQHAEMGFSDAALVVEGRRLSLRLGSPGAISGFVVDEDGRALDAFSVGVESFVPARGVVGRPGGTTAFDGGRFKLEKLVPGSYVLTAVAAGRPPVRSDKIDVRAGAVTANVKIVIARGGIVEGKVVDDQQAPVADVELHFDAVSAVAKSDAVAKTDASGRYRLEGAPAGPFTVSAHKEGYRHTLVSGLAAGSGATVTRDIVLVKGGGFALTGIGAQVGPNGNGLAFAGIMPGDPAELAGLRPGDRVLRIDGEEVAGFSLEDTIQRLRGEKGTVVGITVERNGAIVDVTLTRGEIVH